MPQASAPRIIHPQNDRLRRVVLNISPFMVFMLISKALFVVMSGFSARIYGIIKKKKQKMEHKNEIKDVRSPTAGSAASMSTVGSREGMCTIKTHTS
jgi:hypothetical protein